jgi:hypothetical protein
VWEDVSDEEQLDSEKLPLQRTRPPTLAEVMVDPDFMTEVRLSSETIIQFMTRENILEMVNYLIDLPGFQSDYNRCFKLPFVACDFFICDQAQWMTEKHLFCDDEFEVFQKIFSFFAQPDPYHKKGQLLNTTLGGYQNKICSFWMLQRPC